MFDLVIDIFQWFLSQDLPAIVDVRCEAGSLLSDMYGEEGRVPESKQILLKAMESSQTNQYWHCKLLFQAAVSYILFFRPSDIDV